MKCTIPEISWHNREPVLSVDIFPENRNFYRLASGGGDCHVLIWQMNITDIGAVNQEVISDLTRHQRAVNCVRWSNSGQYLASGDDDANIIIWQLKTDNVPLLEGETGDKEIWLVYKIMRGHKEDVYDLCWSMDGVKILSGSVDNTAILWDVHKGKMDHILTDHKGFVQGVSWDPKNQIIATISTDRTCRIFDPPGKHIKARIHKGKLSVPDTHTLYDKEVKFFHDDTFKSFFRRLQFTPDGSLLIVPSGHIESDSCKTMLNATLIFTLDNFSSPAVVLPLPHQSSTVVRCCPLLFQLHEQGPNPMIKLPYRMIFAVGCDHDIILYDTQQPLPFARFQDIHYTRLTDLTWSQDGLLLIASSTDGFCSLITFEMDELGVPWAKIESEGEENPLDVSGCEELSVKDENVDTNNKDIAVKEKISKFKDDPKEESKKRPSFLQQWTLQTPKKKKLNSDKDECVIGKEQKDEIITISDNANKDASSCKEMDVGKKNDASVNILIPRRKTLVNVGENTKDKAEGINKPKETINVLVPRRIEPKRIESAPSTSEPSCSSFKSSESKDIELENIDQHSEDEQDSSDSEAETLSKEELDDLHKASENIKEFFCRVPKKHAAQSDVKPIVVRRKPRENESATNPEQVGGDKPISTANKHLDAKPIEVRRKPRDEVTNQFKNENKTVKDHSDAKPIAIRKNPKENNAEPSTSINSEKVDDQESEIKEVEEEPCRNDSNDKDSNKNKTENIKNFLFKIATQQDSSIKEKVDANKSDNKSVSSASKHLNAKLIEGKRKPQDEGNEKNKLKGESKKAKGEPDAKPVAAKGKSRGSNKEKCTKTTSEKASKDGITDLDGKSTTEIPNLFEVVCISDSSSDGYNTTPKKPKLGQSKPSEKTVEDRPPKIKVSSLVRRKSAEKTPKKSNALLNFLQKSAEKKTKKQKNDRDDVCVAVTVEENDARDAWKCDSKQGHTDVRNREDTDTDRLVPVEDDKTEDFCLQLEDSQEGCDEEKESQTSIKNESDEIKITGISPLNKNKSGEGKNVSSSNSNVPKTPRRVPLITLASPKGKTKRE